MRIANVFRDVESEILRRPRQCESFAYGVTLIAALCAGFGPNALAKDARNAKPESISDQPLTEKYAAEACTSIASLADQGRLSGLAIAGERYFNGWLSGGESEHLAQNADFEVDKIETVYMVRTNKRTGQVRFAKVSTGGTCASEQVFNIDYLLKSNSRNMGIDAVDDSQDKIRWTYWGGGDYPIHYRDRNFVVTANLRDSNEIRMLSWIKPDGRIRPLCLLNVKSTHRTVTSSANPALCKGIVSDTIKPLKLEFVTDRLPFNHDPNVFGKEFTARYEDYADGIGLLTIDINGDSVKKNIGNFEYASGAGCGSDKKWLHLLSADLGGLIRNPLDKQLRKLHGPLEIYSFKNGYYINGSESGITDDLVQIRDNKIEKVCEFGKETTTEVSKMFSLNQ